MLESQATIIDARTKELPLLYLNKFGLNAAAVAKEREVLANKATHILTFEAPIPAVGFATFLVKKSAAATAAAVAPAATQATTGTKAGSKVVTNGVYSVTVDEATGSIGSLKNLRSGAVRKRHFLSHLYIKINILPRQARDEHRKNSKKVPFSLRRRR